MRHEIQYNDAQNYDTQHNNTQHNNTEHNNTQHNDTQHNNNNMTVIITAIYVSQSVVVLNVVYAERHN
jgi:hypothetical protein